MTLTPHDMTTPAQPPTDGARELLIFAALTAAVYVFGSGALAALAGLVR